MTESQAVPNFMCHHSLPVAELITPIVSMCNIVRAHSDNARTNYLMDYLWRCICKGILLRPHWRADYITPQPTISHPPRLDSIGYKSIELRIV